MNSEETREILLTAENTMTPAERREAICLVQSRKEELIRDTRRILSAPVPDMDVALGYLTQLEILNDIHHREFFLWVNQTLREQVNYLQSLRGKGNVCSGTDP